MPVVHLLDYIAGNVRSLVNAIETLGWSVKWIKTPNEVAEAEVRFCEPILPPRKC
jgi:glutamine amidotransferase/cyclase